MDVSDFCRLFAMRAVSGQRPFSNILFGERKPKKSYKVKISFQLSKAAGRPPERLTGRGEAWPAEERLGWQRRLQT